MRITDSMMIMNFMNDYNNNLERMEKNQSMLESGKRINKPSDDPVAIANSLRIKTDMSRNDAYTKNVSDAKSWLDLTDSSLGQLNDLLQRTRELAVQGSNGSETADDMKKIAAEVEQLKQQMIQVGNTQYNGRYIFAGFKTELNGKTPFESTTDGNGNPINIYNGDNGEIKFEVGAGGNTIQVNISGIDPFDVTGGTNGTGGQSQLLNMMDTLKNALNNGDNQKVSDMLQNIDDEMEKVLTARADAGVKSNRLDLINNRLQTDNYNFTTLLSKNEDADMSLVITNLQMDRNVYQASLAAGARIIEPSLIDFLK